VTLVSLQLYRLGPAWGPTNSSLDTNLAGGWTTVGFYPAYTRGRRSRSKRRPGLIPHPEVSRPPGQNWMLGVPEDRGPR
jgi:hypothetical protein